MLADGLRWPEATLSMPTPGLSCDGPKHVHPAAEFASRSRQGLTMTRQSAGALLAALQAPALVAMLTSISLADVAALCVAVLSVASKELLFGVTHAVGVRCRSSSMVANAYHHRSDALSSAVAIVGIFGILCGFSWLDSFAATAVGLMVTGMGWEVGQESLLALTGDAVA